MLKPFELSIKSYRGKTYNVGHQYDCDELVQRKHGQGSYYMDDQRLLKHKRKPTDLFMDEDTGHTGTRNKNDWDTSRFDIGINDD